MQKIQKNIAKTQFTFPQWAEAGPAMAGLKVQNVLSVALFSIHRGFFVKKHTKNV